MWMDPSAPPMVETGKSVDTAVLGGRQIRTQFSSRFMGQPFNGIGFMGYDNVRGKYVASWFDDMRSEEHTSELQSLMRISYAVFCLKKKNNTLTPSAITLTMNNS